MMKKTTVAATLAALSLCAGLAQAQTANTQPGFYAGIDVGASRLNAGGLSDDTGTSVGVNGGYRVNRNFAVEGAYDHLGNFSPSYQAHALSLSAVGILPLEHGLSVYGKAGFARTEAQAVAASDHNDSPLIGAGVTYDMTSRVFLKAGWDHYTKVGGGQTGEGAANLYDVGVGLRF
jgi:OOP family OmpA-OmpF porin